MCQGFLPLDVRQAVRVGCQRQRPLLNPADALPRLLLKLRIKFHGILDHAGQVLTVAQRTDLGRGMPGCPAGQLVALQQDRVADPQLGEMVKRRAPHDAAANDDDRGVVG